MAQHPLRKEIPVTLQVLLAVCILALLILAPMIITWYLPGPGHAAWSNPTVHVKILAINDFHGQITPGQALERRPAGGAPVLASYLRQAMASGDADGVIIALLGDVVGASPPASGLLLDEPTMLYFNGFANPYCPVGSITNDSCNMVATLGNHEFDKGTTELMRKLHGGDGATTITHLAEPYPGSGTSFVCANVVWKSNNTPILPPYTLRNISGVPVAFIGAATENTPLIQRSTMINDVNFLDEADSVNRYIPEIQRRGVHAIVVLLHEGGTQAPYEGPTQENTTVTGRVAAIIPRLDSDVDVVLSGHTHAFTNAYLNNAGGNPVLLTQAYMYGKAYADVDLSLDRATGEIVQKTARIIPVYADVPPGTSPDPAATALLEQDMKIVGPVVERTIGIAARDITRGQTPDGESAIGDLVVDSERDAMKTDVALMSTGGIRADIVKGTITWGELYSVQPFSNTIVTMNLTGEQVRRVLEQQWQEPLPPHNLAVSGLTYTYDTTRPSGSKVTAVKIHSLPLDSQASYTVSVPDFQAGGGDGYTVIMEGKNVMYDGPVDINALVAYVQSLPQPLNTTPDGRIQRVN